MNDLRKLTDAELVLRSCALRLSETRTDDQRIAIDAELMRRGLLVEKDCDRLPIGAKP